MDEPLEPLAPLPWVEDDGEIDALLAEVEEVVPPEEPAPAARRSTLRLVPPLSGLAVAALSLAQLLGAGA
jgi:hypothetical protein